jgi:hypothetical protein
MVRSFDHLTIVVDDLAKAKRFLGLLGFREAKSVIILGPTMAACIPEPKFNSFTTGKPAAIAGQWLPDQERNHRVQLPQTRLPGRAGRRDD